MVYKYGGNVAKKAMPNLSLSIVFSKIQKERGLLEKFTAKVRTKQTIC